jgi:hypothetical protein
MRAHTNKRGGMAWRQRLQFAASQAINRTPHSLYRSHEQREEHSNDRDAHDQFNQLEAPPPIIALLFHHGTLVQPAKPLAG